MREALRHEYEEAGRVTAEAYREFVGRRRRRWHEYLDAIADVEGRADRTTIFVALDDDRIVGSATLELFDRVETDDDPTAAPAMRRTSACWACTPTHAARASPGR